MTGSYEGLCSPCSSLAFWFGLCLCVSSLLPFVFMCPTPLSWQMSTHCWMRGWQMPHHLLSILQDLYYTDDEYTLLDGDKQASVQPEFGVKQGCPLSPPAFFHLLERWWWTSLCCPMSMTSCRPCSTGSETMLTGNLYLTVNTQKSEVMCFNSRSDNRLPPLYYDGTQQINNPTPTHSNTWAWCVTKISIWPLRLMQRWDP